MEWDAYEMFATDSNGKSLQFSFFITGVLYCLFRTRMGVSTPDDYISIHLSNEANGLSVKEMEELIDKRAEEKRLSQHEGKGTED